MATRKTIKETFLSDLEAASGSLVDNENVVLTDPNKVEDYPSIVYEAFDQPNPYGGASTHNATDDANMDSGPHKFYEYIGIRFDVYVLADTESEKAEIYEALRSHFNRYNMWETPRDFHGDCKEFEMVDGGDADDVASTDSVRGDRITFELVYKRVQKN